MLFRALFVLTLVIALSVVATIYFGQDVLIALGLILVQAKIIAKKIASIEWPALLTWLKTQADAFFKIELIKRWFMTTVLPLVLGKAALRRIADWTGAYSEAVRLRYAAMMQWYLGLDRMEKTLAALIILFATLALSVTSVGLWLILFSVQLPLWIAAAVGAFGRMVWSSVQKSTFRALAFLQLKWLWRAARWILPKSWLRAKRRFDYRVARSVIRRRKMTLRQLENRKDNLPFRIGLLIEFLTHPRTR